MTYYKHKDSETGEEFDSFEVFYSETGPLELGHAPGWYWWDRFPGREPSCDPIGPFESEADAIADAHKCF